MERTKHYQNPVLSGFYPDPSACRAGDDYYLVNSTFAYFPGLPIFRSRDLVNWTQIGNALERPEQLDLPDGTGHSRGLFAPTIRHHDGSFYIVCTNIDTGGNFVVTAKDPAGPWSNPVFLDAPGIDPSLFFDDDGKAWYCGTRPAPEGPVYNGNWEVWLQEFDTKTLSLRGETHGLWRGALREAIWPEGPHIYKKDGSYYLFIAEGGTGPDHAVSVARAENIKGPWEGKKANPILTHRHLGYNADITNVGHGDLVNTANGEWWMLHLASRPYGGHYSNMGRETFMVPIEWQDGWPIASPLLGRVPHSHPVPNLPEAPARPLPACEHFDDPQLPLHWLTLRTPQQPVYSLTDRHGHLRLFCAPANMRDTARPAFAGRRQQHKSWTCSTKIEFAAQQPHETAGLVLIQSNEYHYRLELGLVNSKKTVRLIMAAGAEDQILAEAALDDSMAKSPALVLSACAREQKITFYYGPTAHNQHCIIENVDASILSTERASGFVGTVLGVYASGNGKASENHADVDWFEYQAIEPQVQG